jgi:glycosyltransferase involved in cell wall biosynthesis
MAWISRACAPHQYQYEVIMVNDGSTDNSWNVVKDLAKQYPALHGMCFQRNYGKSSALHCGFEVAEGDVIITMDADLQDSPDEIPQLYQMIMMEGYDMVSGWKKKRYDPVKKTLPSKLFNTVARKCTGIKLHDFNCGLKAYRKKAVKSIEIYGEMHRYIPVLIQQAGFKKIGELIVHHHARKYGESKFGWGRFTGLLDLLTVLFISKFAKKPMHFFGLLGSMMFLVGLGTAVFLGVHKIICMSAGQKATLVTNSPYFYIGLTVMIIGSLLFLSGYLGELILRQSGDRKHYLIEEQF